MVGTQFVNSILICCSVVMVAVPALANQAHVPEQQSTPIDRGYGQHDACFGDKYESDDDLKTGNEIFIEEVLRLLNSPGT